MEKLKTASFILLIFSPCFSSAQVKTIKEKSMITDRSVTITIQGDYKEASKNRVRKEYTLLYKRDANKLMLGNKCAEEVMHKYDFEYAIVPKNINMSASRYFFHNFFADTKLFFKNGPFWKSRMRKKVADCRIKSGDFVD